MKDWGDARSRYEEDLQRKGENMWFGSNFVARAFVRRTKTKKIDYRHNHLVESDGSSLMSDSELEEIEMKEHGDTVIEGEGEGDDENRYKGKTPKGRPVTTQAVRKRSDVKIKKQRAQTAGRNKRSTYTMPQILDKSKEQGNKL